MQRIDTPKDGIIKIFTSMVRQEGARSLYNSMPCRLYGNLIGVGMGSLIREWVNNRGTPDR